MDEPVTRECQQDTGNVEYFGVEYSKTSL